MKGKHLSIIAKKEFRGLFNERTILLAVLLQLFIALFSSFLMVGMPVTIRRCFPISRTAGTSGSSKWISRPALLPSRSANSLP